MVPERGVLLLAHLALFVLLFLLLLDDGEELVALGLGLLGEHHFSLEELSASGLVELNGLLLGELLLCELVSAGLALTLFEGSLSAKGVDFTLTISSTLLKLSESLDLEFLLLLETTLLGGTILFLAGSFSVVTDNF